MNVVLCGLPRSGTTLVCSILNTAAATIALHEPLDVAGLPKDGSLAAAEVVAAFDAIRAQVLAGGAAPTKVVGGLLPDNPFPTPTPGGAVRTPRVGSAMGAIGAGRQMPQDFVLAIKHPAAFSALLPWLTPLLSCFAIVRNPVGVLASWSTCDLPVRHGRAPAAEQFKPALAAALNGAGDEGERQVLLLEWFLRRYAENLPRSRILSYEQLVASGGRILGAVAAEPVPGQDHLVLRQDAYPPALIAQTKTRLLALPDDSPLWRFYHRDEVAGYR